MADFAASSIVTSVSVERAGTAELLFRAAHSMGLAPDWVTPQGVFAIRVGDSEQYINLARSPLNSDTSISLARDKYLTRRILQRHDIQNIPFTLTGELAHASEFLARHGTIIAKPRYGSGAQDIHIVASLYALEALDIDKYLLEKYIPGTELRYLILNGRVLAVHRSDYGTSVCQDRPLKRISYHPHTWDGMLTTLSVEIAEIFGLKFAAIDYMIDESGHAYVLEVNSRPGLKWFHAPTEGPAVDVASYFMKALLGDDMTRDIYPRGLKEERAFVL